MAFVFGNGDAHLMGKLLDELSPEVLTKMGFTGRERARAEGMFENLDSYLDKVIGPDWNDVEVA